MPPNENNNNNEEEFDEKTAYWIEQFRRLYC